MALYLLHAKRVVDQIMQARKSQDLLEYGSDAVAEVSGRLLQKPTDSFHYGCFLAWPEPAIATLSVQLIEAFVDRFGIYVSGDGEVFLIYFYFHPNFLRQSIDPFVEDFGFIFAECLTLEKVLHDYIRLVFTVVVEHNRLRFHSALGVTDRFMATVFERSLEDAGRTWRLWGFGDNKVLYFSANRCKSRLSQI